MTLPEQAAEVAAPTPRPLSDDPAETRKGVVTVVATYVSWGFLPILFRLVEAAGSLLIVAERTLFSVVVLGAILAFGAGFAEVRALLTNWKTFRVIALSTSLLVANWLLYVWAVETGQLLEASFGYFINPLFSVAIGMVFLGERQSRLQTVAIGIAAVAIGIQAAGLGSVPFIALGLASSFAFYGFLRKTAPAGPASGLFAETVVAAPFALAYVAFDIATRGLGAHADPVTMTLLALTGPATALPLLLYAYGIRRLRLTTVGILQYLAPSLQFLVAVLLFGEHLNGIRLLSFGLIWCSLAIFSYDSFRRRGINRAAAQARRT